MGSEEGVDLDMDKVEVVEAAVVAVVDVTVMVEAVEEEAITIVTTTTEGRITIMELIHWILQENLHLMYGTIFVLNKGQSKRGSIIMMTVVSHQE